MNIIENARADWASYRARRAAARKLDAELATYRNPSDIEDLLATLDRAEGPEVEYMRGVLHQNLAEHYRRAA